MGYRFDADEPVADAVRRIATEQLDAALADVRDETDLDQAEAVHDCRKRCKKVRAVSRLVADGVTGPDGPSVDRLARKAAHRLAGTRDAQARAATFRRVLDGLGPGASAAMSRTAEQLARGAATAALSAEDVAAAEDLLDRARAAVAQWRFEDEGWAIVDAGLASTYRAGRRGLAVAGATGDPADFHEWRKHAKYSWYHVRLLEPAAPSLLAPLAENLSRLADCLGDAHDLAETARAIDADRAAFGGRHDATEVVELLDVARRDLDRRALSLGARLYAESAPRFASRMARYWHVWRTSGDELPTGGVADVQAAGGA